ncbi:uncharacterized protein LOC114518042 isoform X2 [Dendronephthya gigantea]|uniref:uncharacterized protein LOC114518042 isoform X2 n=1 Tax=Dendronephthya gigantea TaxID=151771 RepID=UPI00106BE5F7|nr:uncharacterized protein LOC114518042 isoform X2 [Dendronephthya gigantea]
MADSSESACDSSSIGKSRTVRFKTSDISQAGIASKIEKLLKSGKNYRGPRTRKRVQNKVRFLDGCGRPIPVRPKAKRPRKRINRRKNNAECDNNSADDTFACDDDIVTQDEFDSLTNDQQTETPDDILNNIIEECAQLLNDDQQQSKYNWKKRMTNLSTNWESSRQKIFETWLSCTAVLSSICSKCFIQETRIHCRDCVHSTNLCSSCDKEVQQKFPLHDRQGIYHGYYKPLSPKQSLSADGKLETISRLFPPRFDCCPSCLSTGTMVPVPTESQCIVVTIKGVESFNINLHDEQVTVETNLPSGLIQQILEQTGRKAILRGHGATQDRSTFHIGAAVAIMSGENNVQGVIQFVQVDKKNV